VRLLPQHIASLPKRLAYVKHLVEGEVLPAAERLELAARLLLDMRCGRAALLALVLLLLLCAHAGGAQSCALECGLTGRHSARTRWRGGTGSGVGCACARARACVRPCGRVCACVCVHVNVCVCVRGVCVQFGGAETGEASQCSGVCEAFPQA
jgi:hypothetical protein